ncbi:hypothetical protein KY285_009928 [Solanum tuberosum]|nr:hypothetical protein KY285_009928 [Solanum tuberosum]
MVRKENEENKKFKITWLLASVAPLDIFSVRVSKMPFHGSSMNLFKATLECCLTTDVDENRFRVSREGKMVKGKGVGGADGLMVRLEL